MVASSAFFNTYSRSWSNYPGIFIDLVPDFHTTFCECALKTHRALYSKYGFVECRPFADCVLNPNNVIITRDLNVQGR